MNIYGVVRPNGELVDCVPSISKDEAFLLASHAERSLTGTGDQYRVERSFGAACWRAYGESFGWGPALARELGIALGYVAVSVEITAKPY